MYNNTVSQSYDNPLYTVHMIVGGAGCDEMNPSADADANATKPVPQKPTPQWLAAANGQFGMGLLTVTSATELSYQWYDSTTGTVADSVTITKAPQA